MNERILNLALFFFFLLIGMNGFLTMGNQLLYEDGTQLNLFYGLENNGLGYAEVNQCTDIDLELDASSSSPSSEQGFAPAKCDGNPVGINTPYNYLITMGAGTQLVIIQIDDLFANTFQPLFYILLTVITAIQVLGFAYLMSIVLRSIFGRRI